MLLPISIITAVLIGSWIFTALIETGLRNAKVSTQRSHNSQFSLWSLIIFLFFPTESITPSPSLLPRRELN
ncbi:MAG: hypothetical protein KME05_17550 [Gloeocapsa sp. UFS-A4-WI-NPMV-4B04]|jgi:hypothetical protein|nr:hypothetical protein [Gloeocapsa sp. UFS-A4-WI-NPMV-4B04]